MTRTCRTWNARRLPEAGLGRSSSRSAAPELVGVHGHLDAARATL